MRKKRFIKIGLYAYVLLLLSGVSYALYGEIGDSVVFSGEAHTLDTRPPEPTPEIIPEPDLLESVISEYLLEEIPEPAQEEPGEIQDEPELPEEPPEQEEEEHQTE